MRYVINSGSFYEVPLTSGTVQNTGNVPIEISDTETFRSGIILNPGEKFSWDNATLYARVTYLEKEGLLAVVPFKKAAGGGGGGSEYVLPVATASRLGGVKSSNAAGAISISPTGMMTYNAPSVEPLSAPEWEPNTVYPVNALVEYNNNVYMCLVNHTSGLFIDDLDDGYWKLIGVSIPTATEMKLGGVKSSSDAGKVTVLSDGTMQVNGGAAEGSTYTQKIVTGVVAPYEMLLQVGDSNYCKPPIDVLKKTGGSDNVTLTLEDYNNPSAYTGTSDFLKIENGKAKLYNYKEYPITPQTLSTIDIGVSDEVDFSEFVSISSLEVN